MKNLLWFQTNLRTEDNEALSLAIETEKPVLAIYCLDPKLFENTIHGFKKTEKFRAKFLLETLIELKKTLTDLNIPLYFFFESAEKIIPEFVLKNQISTIFLEKVWTSEELNIVEKVKQKTNISWQFVFDNFLYHPEDIPFKNWDSIPEVFTNFRKKVEANSTIRDCYESIKLPKENFHATDTEIPTLENLGFDNFETHPNTAFPFQGGTKNGLNRIENYYFESENLSQYKATRNGLIGVDYSSKLSAWLANGSISARMIFEKVQQYEDSIEKNESTYWLIFELIWRDFFKYIALKHGDKIFQPSGFSDVNKPQKSTQKALKFWTEGKTEEPFVNANMVELAKTGFMSNRGRQNVASFWAKEWQQDWTIGAAYFESLLIDYDVHSNYGNWLYVAGVGNDPRDRKFNIKKQASMYDPKGDFQDLWNND